MKLLDTLFGRGGPAVAIDLSGATVLFESRLPALEQKHVELELVRARLADGCRDAKLEPIAPAAFEELASDLDIEALRRLMLLSSAFDSEELRAAAAALAVRSSVGDQLRIAFIGVARERKLLTLELMRTTPARLEEFTRVWIAEMGAEVAGENPEQSEARLKHLDYARLLAEADRAQRAAQGRKQVLEELRAHRERERGKS